jgi:hypothetical protein
LKGEERMKGGGRKKFLEGKLGARVTEAILRSTLE